MIRSLALIAGLGLVGAAAHVNILACGGYAQPTAVITLALAIGVAVGSVAIGNAAQNKRRMLAVLIAVGLLCGEGYALIATGERTISARDASIAPITAAVEARKQAEARVVSAELAVLTVAATSPRLEAAIAAKAAAESRAMDDASKKSCAANCRALLEAATATAAREVDAARAEISGYRLQAELRLAEARNAVVALPATRSASPLADRLGIAGWALDLLAAGLLSIGVNGLGAALIALSAHGRSLGLGMPQTVHYVDPARSLQLDASAVEPVSVASVQVASVQVEPAKVLAAKDPTPKSAADSVPPRRFGPVKPVAAPLPVPLSTCSDSAAVNQIVSDLEIDAPADANSHSGLIDSSVADIPKPDNVVALPALVTGRVSRFLVDALEPSETGRIEVVDLYSAYRAWCTQGRVTALGAEMFGDDLQSAIAVTGLDFRSSRGKVFLLNVTLSDVAIARRA
jgi:hypothetical protein